MEFIEDFMKSKNDFASKINDSKYLEKPKKLKTIKGVNDICELIIGQNEIEYNSLSNTEKINYIRNKKLEFASSINLSNNYIKKWKTKLIQNGLQDSNNLSSILYLNEKYNVKTIIYNSETNEYYTTTLKNYEPIYCQYKNNSWHLIDSKNINYDSLKINNEIKDLDSIIKLDIDTIMIHSSFLEALSKYKLSDLVTIAEKEGISMIDSKGKKKIKKVIYDEINLKHYIQDI
tara:strand:+ start:12693 stop:13388 length:696 start_codon:yes stop_codon:yes gene_type:complete